MVSTKDTNTQPERPAGMPTTHRPVVMPDPPFMSEGVAQEVIANGEAIDPGTGRKVGVADLPASRRKEAQEAAQRRAKADEKTQD